MLPWIIRKEKGGRALTTGHQYNDPAPHPPQDSYEFYNMHLHCPLPFYSSPKSHVSCRIHNSIRGAAHSYKKKSETVHPAMTLVTPLSRDTVHFIQGTHRRQYNKKK